MGWFSKETLEETDAFLHTPDPKNPYSAAVVDEGEFITIRPKIVLETLTDEDTESGSPRDKLDIP